MIIKSFELEKLKSKNLIYIFIWKNEGIKEDIIKDVFLKNFDGEI